MISEQPIKTNMCGEDAAKAIVSARDFLGNLERKESSMARKSLVAVVLAAGLMALGCGEQKKAAMLTPSPAMVATVTGSVSPGMDGLASAFALGNAYQMMGSVGYVMETDDNVGAEDATAIDVGFTYYWKPVNNDDKPIGLQEFAQKATKVFANISMVTPEVSDSDTVWEVGGNYGFMENKLQAEVAVGGQTDVFGFQVGAKYYLMDLLTVSAAYKSATFSGTTDVTANDILVNAEYAVQLGGRWLDAGLSVDLQSGDTGVPELTTIGVNATYYVLKELGVSVQYANVSGDAKANGFGVGAKYYYGPLAVGANWQQMTPDGGEAISDIGIVVEYRF
jgi:hypothetical protein